MPSKLKVRYAKFTPEEMAIDAADVDASKPTKQGYVKLDADVRKAFPSDESVNAALRSLMKNRKNRTKKSA